MGGDRLPDTGSAGVRGEPVHAGQVAARQHRHDRVRGLLGPGRGAGGHRVVLRRGVFGWLLIASGVAGIGQTAWGFHRPSQLVLAADGFEWTSPWPSRPVRRTWQECGPFFLVYRSRGPGPTRIGYYTGWPAWAASWQGQPATRWQGQAARWPDQPMPPHGKREIIGGSYETIGPAELVELMNDYRNRAAQQAR